MPSKLTVRRIYLLVCGHVGELVYTPIGTTTLSYAPQAQEVFQNETAHVSCQASYSVNRTDLAYVWYFNDKLLDFDIDPSYKIVSLVSIARWQATNSNTTATTTNDDVMLMMIIMIIWYMYACF